MLKFHSVFPSGKVNKNYWMKLKLCQDSYSRWFYCLSNGKIQECHWHAQTGVFHVFSRRKVSEHVRHAHTGMPYVLGRMWEVEGGLCLRVGVVVGVVLVVFRSPLPSDGHGNGDPWQVSAGRGWVTKICPAMFPYPVCVGDGSVTGSVQDVDAWHVNILNSISPSSATSQTITATTMRVNINNN